MTSSGDHARPDRDQASAFLTLIFGGVTDESGNFTVGQMPIWNSATKCTTWCATLPDAVTALAAASEACQDAYFPVALHDPSVALAVGQQREYRRAATEGRAPRTLGLEHVRGGVESAVAIVGLWLDEDHASGRHKQSNLPPNLAAVLDYLRKLPDALRLSLLVNTGGGVHGWLLFREPLLLEDDAERARAASLARRFQVLVRVRIAPQYAHDATADLARVLRVPGTLNTKYGTLAHAIDLDTGESIAVPGDVHRVDPSEVEDELDLLAVQDSGPRPKRGTEAAPAPAVGSKQSPRVQALLDGSSRIRGLFLGTGKPDLGPDGRTRDTTSSGYDFSLVMALARKGITDPSELATAVWLRPDGAAAAKGRPYVGRTVQRAMERVAAIAQQEADEAKAMLDFEVEAVRIFDCNPAQYELTVEGTPLRFTTGQLLSPRGFVRVFTDALKRVPCVPKETEDWSPIVNDWLARAERVEMPPEASDEPALREAVVRQVNDLPVGDAAEDLDHGKAVELDDKRRAFKSDTLLRALKEDHPHLTRTQLCRVLRDLGYVSGSHRIGGEPVRSWACRPIAPHTRARES